MLRRARMVSVLAMLVAGALGMLSSTQVWLHVTLNGASSADLEVTGASAIAVLTPMSLAALALAAALSIVGLWLRYAFGVLAVAIGGWMLVANVGLLAGKPVGAVAGVVSTSTGVSGVESIAALVDRITPTFWPQLTIVAWVLLVAAGAYVLLTARGWRTGGRKYRTEQAPARGSGPLDAVDSWDELTHGDDPTVGADDVSAASDGEGPTARD